MGNCGKKLALLLILMFSASMLTWAESASAQSIPKPSVPEFTVKYVDNSYHVPSTSTINPYTGKNEAAANGYFVQNKSIEITIKNQPFDRNASVNLGLYYTVNVKGHFQDWVSEPAPGSYIQASESDGTIVTCGLSGNNGSDPFYGAIWIGSPDIATGGQIDFKIKALIGHFNYLENPPSVFSPRITYHSEFISNESSDWSSTQTLTIPDNSYNDFFSGDLSLKLALIGIAFLGMAVAVLLLYVRKIKNRLPKQ